MAKQTSGSVDRESTIIHDSINLKTGEWTEATLICGSLGILLDLYQQSTEIEITIHHGPEEASHTTSTNLIIKVNSSDPVCQYLGSVADSLRTSLLDGPDAGTATHFPNGKLDAKFLFDEGQIHSCPYPIWLQYSFQAPKPSLSAIFQKGSHDVKVVERLLRQVSHIAGQLDLSSALIRDVDSLSAADKQHIRQWTPAPDPMSPSCAHLLIQKQVLKSPGAVAIHSWDGKLTYKELDELSSHLAAQLSAANVPRKSVIPLLFEKSMWTVVAMMAILKSGHAFLLLDASHPTGRLEMLIQDVQGPIILASETQRDRAVLLAPQVILVSSHTVFRSTDAPDPGWDQSKVVVDPHDLGVVVFTSGTTGRPKATAIEHHSLCSALTRLAKLANLSETSRYYQFSSYAWDLAYGEILMTLFCGGCICIPTEEDRMNRLAQSMTWLDADFVFLTPTVLRLLSPPEVPTMRNIMAGGEKLTRDLVRTWANHVHLTTVYGPAEGTVGCMVNQQYGEDLDPALIGSSFGCRVWVTLVENIDRLAPVGVAGELLIEGPNVARGYLNDHEKTAKSFLTVPPAWMTAMGLEMLPDSRFYRTGDLVRYTPDGKLVFLGRRDSQVKLRGQRIELEEVQSQIQRRLRLPRAQVFVDIVDVVGDRKLPSLAAFVHTTDYRGEAQGAESLAEHIAPECERIRLALTEVLPEFMVPTIWIPLLDVPLSPSGKLDRRALLQLGNEYLSCVHSAPRKTEELTEIQQRMSDLWAQALSTQRPSLTDNFFLLGGDSVKAMQLVSLARQANLELSVKDIFRHPTLSALSSTAKAITHSNGLERSLAFSILSKHDLSKSIAYLTSLGLDQENIVDVFPCTQLQESMFSFSLSVPGSYLSQYVFTIRSGRDAGRIREALERVVDSIPILKARFLPSQTGINQAIIRGPLQWTDTQQSLNEYLESDRQKTFDMGEPLARYSMVKDPTLEQVHFVWTLHHSIFDGWSIDSILGRVQSQVEDGSMGGEDLDGNFSKFVRFSQSMDTDGARAFWRKELHNAPVSSFPPIPADNIQIADGSCISHSMDVSHFSKPGITVTVLARAGLSLLLSQYENSKDVVFGNTVHGRSSLPLDLHNILGPTLATLPVRVKINQKQTVSQFLNDLQDQFVATMPYEQFGLLRIRDIDQDTRASSSFRVLLLVQNADSIPPIGDNITGREAFRCLHEYPLVITITPEPARVNMSWTFDERCLTEDQVRSLAAQFEQALIQICSVTDATKLCDLELASKRDKALFFDWNAVHHKSLGISALDLLRTQIKQDPSALAVDAWNGTLSYEALDKVSDTFAAELVRLGVKPNTLIGHCFEKSMWAPVALIAALKAGGAFAPFSPGYPRERLLTFTRDAGIRLIICSRQQQASLSEGPWEILVVDDESLASLPPSPEALLPASISPDSLIYALQTSGTTGQPKTFTVRHAAFATGAATRASLIRRGSGMRVLQFGPYTFRLGIENILATLTAGGCICIPSDSAIMNDLSGYMREARINFANVTPSVARTLIPCEVPDLEVLLVSGEPPDRDLIATWASRVQLVNGYGPSEFTAKQTLNFSMTKEDPQNLGRGVGASLWVIDPENPELLSPLGAVGELLIEGPTLADGYINRPSEMEKRFIAPPSWLRDFRREKTIVFKTGDLVRYNSDGSLTSVGRADGQVKFHGQRFEAKEVEHHIKNFLCDGHLDVLVDILRFHGQKSDVVVAFIAPKEHKLKSAIELDPTLGRQIQTKKRKTMEYLSRFLPGYMIPSIFLSVSIIPVTANGKADRRALKAFGSELPLSSAQNTEDDARVVVKPPVSDGEITLHQLWQKVLGLEPDHFGLDDHFFELGGSSMSAIRLVTMAREAEVSLVAQSIFKYPVLRDMASQLKLKGVNMTPKHVPRLGLLRDIGCSLEELNSQLSTYGLTETDVEDAYPCLDLQAFYMKKAVVFPGSCTYQHLYELPSNVDVTRLKAAVECVWRATPSLRTRVVSISGTLVQVVCKEDFVCRHFAQWESCMEEDRKVSWAMGAPLSRFSIVAGEQDRPAQLVWSSNHVVWDQWSRALILDDIDYAYHHNCLSSTRPSYSEFIAQVCRQGRLNLSFDSPLLRKEYMGRRFASPTGSIEWDKYLPQNSRLMKMDVDLPVLEKLSVSHSSLLISCWTLALAAVEGSTDVLTVNEINGRVSSFPEVENLAAPVVGAVPLCVSIHPGTMGEHAALVQKHTIEGLALQHSVGLGNQLLSQIENSVYWVLVNDQDGHGEPATASLGLRRNRAEKVAIGAWPFYLTFNVFPGNTKVELEAVFDEKLIALEKAVKFFACLKFLLRTVFTPGGLDLNTTEIQSAMHEVVQGGRGILEEVKANSSVEYRAQNSGYDLKS